MAITSTRRQTSINLFLFLLILPPLTTQCFEIYRSGYQGNANDVFMTSESVCNGSSPRCHDYYAGLNTCNACMCTDNNETFGFLGGSWRCFGKTELEQESGCFVQDQQSKSHRLDVVTTKDRLYLNLSISSECTYQYKKNTYYRTCDGRWAKAGSIGSSRYELIVQKRTTPTYRYRYWIKVQTDAQANAAFEGKIMKLSFHCQQPGRTPWEECIVFKEKYIVKPVKCPKSFSTITPSTMSVTSPNTTYSPLPKTTATTTEELEVTESSTTEASLTTNSTYYNQASQGARVHKNVIIGVSAAGGVMVVGIVIVICVCCCRKLKRRDISKYTAALYDSSQDQGSAGIYAATNIRLSSTSKSVTLTSHSNPAYERGHDYSIKVTDSRKVPSSTPPKSSPPRLVFSSESYEGDNAVMSACAKEVPRSPIKQRGNMLVKYENVTILSDLRPESVPDAERFYDNPGDNTRLYHVLENSESVPSYAEAPPSHAENIPSNNSHSGPSTGNSLPDFSLPSLNESNEQTSGNCCNDVSDEPIYANSPATVSSDPRDEAFSFEVVPPNEHGNNMISKESIDYGNDNENDIYENSEALRSKYSHDQAVENEGYMSDDDDDDDDNDDVTHKIEPIYDNPSTMSDTADHVESHTGDSPLLSVQSDDAVYQELQSSRAKASDYQSLTPVTARKTKPKPKPKPAHKSNS